MTQHEQILLEQLNTMAEQAPSVGLCSAPFRAIHTLVMELVAERDKLLEYRVEKPVKPYKPWSGKCPSCGVVFVDDSTPYCGNCGQKISFKGE